MGLPLLALWVAWRKRNTDAWLLSVPLLVNASFEYYSFTVYLLYVTHAVSANAVMSAGQTPIRAFNVAWTEVVSFAFSVTLLIFLVVRTIRLAREKARAASEMQAVKTLQSLLLARSQQPTPGYAVETAYRPAAEVGGDFFLVSPGKDGSLVVVVGDVSGKGLLAAMRVSLILGALNRESSRLPDEVLNRLNLVLLGQGDMGFTTACCVRVEANGNYSFANAGHLNPYVDGREVEAPGALPLGLKADQTYNLLTGHLETGQRLVLLSDGVPEARAKKQLLGFDKLVELTRLGAGEIADAAQNFGQEDDITVLALALA
jgi:serine phosphatase RsbU (regulator of sigma subunit)